MARKIVIGIILICVSAFAFSSEDYDISNISQNPEATFRLFPTNNMWTFLQLNTITGQIKQLHFDTSGDSRLKLIVNDENLAKNLPNLKGRFTLYPTQNMYNFILLDQDNGRTWQVQWSFEKENRMILPIELFANF